MAPHRHLVFFAGAIISRALFAADGALLDSRVRTEFINDPPSDPSCHASTIVETPSHHLVAAWFGGLYERHEGVVIRLSRLVDGKWLPDVEVANGVQSNGPRMPTWNPVLFQAPGGPLFLFYKVGPSPSQWWGMVKTSTDEGKTWSEARRLPDGILGPIKNKPVVLADGAWLSGSSTEGNSDGWLVHFEMSRDAGATWTITGRPAKGPGLDAIQPSVLFFPNGKLEALCRTKQGVLAQTWSADGGKTWSPLTATNLPNPNSGTDAVTLADGRQLLVYNHSGHRAEEPKGDRFPLDVALSGDGVTWRHMLTLETEPVGSGYAYPAVIQTNDGLVHITYSWNRKMIKHVVLDPKRL